MVGRGRIGGLGIVGLMLKAVLGGVMFVLWELRGVEMIQTLLEIGEAVKNSAENRQPMENP